MIGVAVSPTCLTVGRRRAADNPYDALPGTWGFWDANGTDLSSNGRHLSLAGAAPTVSVIGGRTVATWDGSGGRYELAESVGIRAYGLLVRQTTAGDALLIGAGFPELELLADAANRPYSAGSGSPIVQDPTAGSLAAATTVIVVFADAATRLYVGGVLAASGAAWTPASQTGVSIAARPTWSFAGGVSLIGYTGLAAVLTQVPPDVAAFHTMLSALD